MSDSYTPSLHLQSTAEPGTAPDPASDAPATPPPNRATREAIGRAGTASSKHAETALLDALTALRDVRRALQAADHLDHDYQHDEARAVRSATDAALCHVAARISRAIDDIRAADTALADVLKEAGWTPAMLEARRRPHLPF